MKSRWQRLAAGGRQGTPDSGGGGTLTVAVVVQHRAAKRRVVLSVGHTAAFFEGRRSWRIAGGSLLLRASEGARRAQCDWPRSRDAQMGDGMRRPASGTTGHCTAAAGRRLLLFCMCRRAGAHKLDGINATRT